MSSLADLYKDLEKETLAVCRHGERHPINIAVFTSLGGTMALNEMGLARAYLMAIKEVNSGIADCDDHTRAFSKRYVLVPKLYDGASSNPIYRQCAEALKTTDSRMQCHAVFGCWTSAARKTVQAMLDTLESRPLYFYPVQFEGLETHALTVYTGAIPNQQVFPVMKFYSKLMGQYTKRRKNYEHYLIIGSDYIYPRAVLAQMSRRLKYYNKTFGHEFIPFLPEGVLLAGRKFFESLDIADIPSDDDNILKKIPKDYKRRVTSVKDAVRRIIQRISIPGKCPDVIFNFANGDVNHYLFQELLALQRMGTISNMPSTVSFSMSLNDLQPKADCENLAPGWTGHHFIAASYFPSEDPFSTAFRAEWDAEQPTDSAWNAYACQFRPESEPEFRSQLSRIGIW